MSELTREQVESHINDRCQNHYPHRPVKEELLATDAALRARVAELEQAMIRQATNSAQAAKDYAQQLATVTAKLAARTYIWTTARPTVAGWYWFKNGSAGGDDTMNDTTKTDPITDILTERGKTYGLFMDQAATSQALKDTLRDGPRWGSLTNDMAEALEVIAMKMSRIVHGDPNHIDSWDDIAGYARLVADRLRGVAR